MSPVPLAVYGLSELRTALLRKDMLQAVEQALISHADGRIVAPPPGVLLFENPPGDCHIKSGYAKDGSVFVVKLAMGFYENPSRGLETNNGLVLVFDSHTGKTLAVLNDEGWLTSWRTAAAGALAARAGAPSQVSALGIIGSGHQAELQARWTCELLGVERVVIWGRSPEKAQRLAKSLAHHGLKAQAADSVESVFAQCNLVITCTPSAQAIVPSAVVRDGTHIVALGADSPGKQELDPLLLQRARVLMTDDRAQCVDHGEMSHAIRAGLITEQADVSLGDVLAGKARGRFSDDDLTIADLTGLAAQDVALATLAVERMQAAN
ncbi:ornithine cyclodeaminase family protein [Pseudomonas fluorescens]